MQAKSADLRQNFAMERRWGQGTNPAAPQSGSECLTLAAVRAVWRRLPWSASWSRFPRRAHRGPRVSQR
jgi:hypothetical protein